MSEAEQKVTKKMFREYLNKLAEDSPLHRNGRYHQSKRGYGDYLYFQDREKFNVDFEEWKRIEVSNAK